jgi:Tfp pilus assembly protein PilO
MSKQKIYIYACLVCITLVGGLLYRYSETLEKMFPSGEEIAVKQKQLIKFRQMVLQRSELEARLVALNRALERAESGLLTGETQAIAAVDIQNLLNDLANRNQVEIKSMRVLKATAVGDEEFENAIYMRIPLQVSIISAIRQVKEMLYSIETYPKLLRVENLRLRVTDLKKPEQIHTDLTVAGYMKRRREDK